MDQKSSDKDRNSSGASLSGDHQPDVAQAVDDTKEHLLGLADRQKAAGADQIKAFAQAFHKAAENIEGESPTAAGYVQDAAARLDRLSSAVRDRSLDDLMGQVRDFARAQPVAFFGGAVVAGFALSRFLKSSAGTAPARDRT